MSKVVNVRENIQNYIAYFTVKLVHSSKEKLAAHFVALAHRLQETFAQPSQPYPPEKRIIIALGESLQPQ